MADHYIKEIQTVQMEGLYLLSGPSFGGKIAWKMAQQLHNQGEKVALLALFDSSAPGYLKRVPFRKRVFHHLNKLLRLGPNYILNKAIGKVQWLRNRIQPRSQKISSNLSHKSFDSLTEIHHNLIVEEANTQAAKDYVLKPYSGRVILLEAIHQPVTEGWIVDSKNSWGGLPMGDWLSMIFMVITIPCLESLIGSISLMQ